MRPNTKAFQFADCSFIMGPLFKERIPKGHPSRVIPQIINQLDLHSLYVGYSRYGQAAYDPKMLLSLLLYCYSIGIYSCRRIAEVASCDLHGIYICHGQAPDYSTISRFRQRLKDVIMDIFEQLVLGLVNAGVASIETLYVDGTTLEARSNRHKLVWRKNTERYKKSTQEQIHKFIKEVEELTESGEYSDSFFKGESSDLSSEKVDEIVEMMEQAMSKWDKDISAKEEELEQDDKEVKEEKNPEKKKAKREKHEQKRRETRERRKRLEKQKTRLKNIKKKNNENLKEYERQEDILAGRNSYCKTDHDATGMRLKETPMDSRECRPGYNLQIATNAQFIMSLGIFQNGNDGTTFRSFIEQGIAKLSPTNIVADAGYGNEENYELLQEKGINAYLKYPLFDREQNGTLHKQVHWAENFTYNKEEDTYTCQKGKKLTKCGEETRTNVTGYTTTVTKYKAESSCRKCPLAKDCLKTLKNADTKSLSVSRKLEKHKEKARERLTSETGTQLLKNRSIEPEPVFGQLKYNLNYRRSRYFNMAMLLTDLTIWAIAHNLRKYLRICPDLSPSALIKLIIRAINAIKHLFRQFLIGFLLFTSMTPQKQLRQKKIAVAL